MFLRDFLDTVFDKWASDEGQSTAEAVTDNNADNMASLGDGQPDEPPPSQAKKPAPVQQPAYASDTNNQGVDDPRGYGADYQPDEPPPSQASYPDESRHGGAMQPDPYADTNYKQGYNPRAEQVFGETNTYTVGQPRPEPGTDYFVGDPNDSATEAAVQAGANLRAQQVWGETNKQMAGSPDYVGDSSPPGYDSRGRQQFIEANALTAGDYRADNSQAQHDYGALGADLYPGDQGSGPTKYMTPEDVQAMKANGQPDWVIAISRAIDTNLPKALELADQFVGQAAQVSPQTGGFVDSMAATSANAAPRDFAGVPIPPQDQGKATSILKAIADYAGRPFQAVQAGSAEFGRIQRENAGPENRYVPMDQSDSAILGQTLGTDQSPEFKHNQQVANEHYTQIKKAVVDALAGKSDGQNNTLVQAISDIISPTAPVKPMSGLDQAVELGLSIPADPLSHVGVIGEVGRLSGLKNPLGQSRQVANSNEFRQVANALADVAKSGDPEAQATYKKFTELGNPENIVSHIFGLTGKSQVGQLAIDAERLRSVNQLTHQGLADGRKLTTQELLSVAKGQAPELAAQIPTRQLETIQTPSFAAQLEKNAVAVEKAQAGVPETITRIADANNFSPRSRQVIADAYATNDPWEVVKQTAIAKGIDAPKKGKLAGDVEVRELQKVLETATKDPVGLTVESQLRARAVSSGVDFSNPGISRAWQNVVAAYKQGYLAGDVSYHVNNAFDAMGKAIWEGSGWTTMGSVEKLHDQLGLGAIPDRILGEGTSAATKAQSATSEGTVKAIMEGGRGKLGQEHIPVFGSLVRAFGNLAHVVGDQGFIRSLYGKIATDAMIEGRAALAKRVSEISGSRISEPTLSRRMARATQEFLEGGEAGGAPALERKLSKVIQDSIPEFNPYNAPAGPVQDFIAPLMQKIQELDRRAPDWQSRVQKLVSDARHEVQSRGLESTIENMTGKTIDGQMIDWRARAAQFQDDVYKSIRNPEGGMIPTVEDPGFAKTVLTFIQDGHDRVSALRDETTKIRDQIYSALRQDLHGAFTGQERDLFDQVLGEQGVQGAHLSPLFDKFGVDPNKANAVDALLDAVNYQGYKAQAAIYGDLVEQIRGLNLGSVTSGSPEPIRLANKVRSTLGETSKTIELMDQLAESLQGARRGHGIEIKRLMAEKEQIGTSKAKGVDFWKRKNASLEANRARIDKEYKTHALFVQQNLEQAQKVLTQILGPVEQGAVEYGAYVGGKRIPGVSVTRPGSVHAGMGGEGNKAAFEKAWQAAAEGRPGGPGPLPKGVTNPPETPLSPRNYKYPKSEPGKPGGAVQNRPTSGIILGEPATQFHGTPAAYDLVDPKNFNPNGRWGPGYYTHADPERAGEYSRAGYPDMTEVIGEDKLKADIAARRAAGDPSVSELESMLNAKPNMRKVEVPAGTNLLDVSKDQAVYDQLVERLGSTAGANKALVTQGYDGVSSGPMVMIFPESLPKIKNKISGAAGGIITGGGDDVQKVFESAITQMKTAGFDIDDALPIVEAYLESPLTGRKMLFETYAPGAEQIDAVLTEWARLKKESGTSFKGAVRNFEPTVSPGEAVGALAGGLSAGGAETARQLQSDQGFDPRASIGATLVGAAGGGLATRGIRNLMTNGLHGELPPLMAKMAEDSKAASGNWDERALRIGKAQKDALDTLDQIEHQVIQRGSSMSAAPPELIAKHLSELNAYKQAVVQATANLGEYAKMKGIREADRVFYDYIGGKTNLDKMLSYLVPFSMWQTRNPGYWAEELVRNPALGVGMKNYVEQSEAERKRRNLPASYFGSFSVGKVGGKEVFVNPIVPAFSILEQGGQVFVGQQQLASAQKALAAAQATKNPSRIADAEERLSQAQQNLLGVGVGGLGPFPFVSEPAKMLLGGTRVPDEVPGIGGNRPFSGPVGNVLPQPAGNDLYRYILGGNPINRLGDVSAGALGGPAPFTPQFGQRVQSQLKGEAPPAFDDQFREAGITEQLRNARISGKINQSQELDAVAALKRGEGYTSPVSDPVLKSALAAAGVQTDERNLISGLGGTTKTLRVLSPEQDLVNRQKANYAGEQTHMAQAQRNVAETFGPNGPETMEHRVLDGETRTPLPMPLQAEYDRYAKGPGEATLKSNVAQYFEIRNTKGATAANVFLTQLPKTEEEDLHRVVKEGVPIQQAVMDRYQDTQKAAANAGLTPPVAAQAKPGSKVAGRVGDETPVEPGSIAMDPETVKVVFAAAAQEIMNADRAIDDKYPALAAYNKSHPFGEGTAAQYINGMNAAQKAEYLAHSAEVKKSRITSPGLQKLDAFNKTQGGAVRTDKTYTEAFVNNLLNEQRDTNGNKVSDGLEILLDQAGKIGYPVVKRGDNYFFKGQPVNTNEKAKAVVQEVAKDGAAGAAFYDGHDAEHPLLTRSGGVGAGAPAAETPVSPGTIKAESGTTTGSSSSARATGAGRGGTANTSSSSTGAGGAGVSPAQITLANGRTVNVPAAQTVANGAIAKDPKTGDLFIKSGATWVPLKSDQGATLLENASKGAFGLGDLPPGVHYAGRDKDGNHKFVTYDAEGNPDGSFWIKARAGTGGTTSGTGGTTGGTGARSSTGGVLGPTGLRSDVAAGGPITSPEAISAFNGLSAKTQGEVISALRLTVAKMLGVKPRPGDTGQISDKAQQEFSALDPALRDEVTSAILASLHKAMGDANGDGIKDTAARTPTPVRRGGGGSTNRSSAPAPTAVSAKPGTPVPPDVSAERSRLQAYLGIIPKSIVQEAKGNALSTTSRTILERLWAQSGSGLSFDSWVALLASLG